MSRSAREPNALSGEARTVALSRQRALRMGSLPLVMAILNVTPDSFSDGGVHFHKGVAIDAALRMERDGADVIDVGGESTRPGADPVSVAVELERVVPVIEGIRSRSDIPISIDTTKAAVARAALGVGADIVNDVSALRFDPEMVSVLREIGPPVILMHMRGEPRTMQQNPVYGDLMREIRDELARWRDEAVSSGIAQERILVDPGIGFGKTFDQNLEILARFDELAALGPVVIGASRKAFIGNLTGRGNGGPRMAGSLAAVAAAADRGAALVRVHDVAETVDFLKVHRAIRQAGL